MESSKQPTGAGERPKRKKSDERRLHLRAYNRWASLLGHRLCPLSADFAPAKLAELAPFSLVFDYSGPEKPSLRFVGTRLAEAYPPPAGVPSSALQDDTLGARVAELCGRVLAQRSPVSFEGELAEHAGGAILYRGILLPFASPAGDIDLIHAVVTWKRQHRTKTGKHAGGEASPAISALAPPRREPLVEWADGPSADDAADLVPG